MSPWVRIDEKAMDHPKIAGLSDGAFRLWVQGMTHCQKYLTDGQIDRVSLRGLRSYSEKRRSDLITAGLWEPAENGIQIHDYLQWNESREQVLRGRALAKERIKKLRGKQRSRNAVTYDERRANTMGDVSCSENTTPAALEGKGDRGGNHSPERAGAFCRWYEDTHDRLFRVGYMGTQNDYQTALRLVAKFSDKELRDAALVWFGMDDDFATKGTRTVAKFASRITACLQAIQQRGIA